MTSTGRRSEELQKKLQRRNNSLKPADFAKEQIMLSQMATVNNPVERSKAALSDLRKRIDERKRMSKLIDIQQYQEKKEEPIPELIGATFSESPVSDAQESPSRKETLAHTLIGSTQKPKLVPIIGNIGRNNTKPGKDPPRGKMSYNRGQDHYRKGISKGDFHMSLEKALPSQIEVRSHEMPNNDDDDDTEVSEITTDVRIMSAKGASYIEHRMTGNVQMRLARPTLATLKGQHLERDVNINVNSLRHLGTAVEQAKIDLRKEMSPINTLSRRHGLPYEATDYRPSIDGDEADSWGVVIRTNVSKKEEQNGLFSVDKTAAKHLQKLVKEAYSYEGDVFIDATDVKEEHIDRMKIVLQGDCNDSTPINVDEDGMLPSQVEQDKIATSGHSEERNDFPQKKQGYGNRTDLSMSRDANGSQGVKIKECVHDMDHTSIGSDEQSFEDMEKKPANFANNTVSIASEFYNSSLGFLKTLSSQVDTQMKSFQQQGLVSKSNVDDMLGVLEHDVKETKTNLSKEKDDIVIFLGNELESSKCGTNLRATEENMKKDTGFSPDPVEKMLESLKKSYNTGISKCGIDSDLIKENTKTIEEIVANLKSSKSNSYNRDRNDTSDVEVSKAWMKSSTGEYIDENLINDEVSAQGIDSKLKNSMSTKEGANVAFNSSINMPMNE